MSHLSTQVTRFAVVGAATSVLGIATIYGLMLLLRVGPVAANAAGYGVGVAAGFVLNGSWTFRVDRFRAQQIARYVVIIGLCYAANLTVTVTAMSRLHLDPYLAQLPGMLAYSSLMFCGCRWFVFPMGSRTQMSS